MLARLSFLTEVPQPPISPLPGKDRGSTEMMAVHGALTFLLLSIHVGHLPVCPIAIGTGAEGRSLGNRI